MLADCAAQAAVRLLVEIGTLVVVSKGKGGRSKKRWHLGTARLSPLSLAALLFGRFAPSLDA